MRKVITGLALAVAAIVVAQTSGVATLAGFSSAVNKAESISATYTVQRVGDPASNYNVQLAKPNKARLDTPSELIVADGKNISRFNKTDNVYTTYPQTDANLRELFQNDELMLWASFFNDKAWNNVAGSRSAGTVSRRGTELASIQVTMDRAASRRVNIFVDPKDNAPRQAQLIFTSSTGKTDTRLLDTKSIALGEKMKEETFAFSAPESAEQVSYDEFFGARWYTDLEEAKAAAQKANKMIFLDFYATWCGPCKKLDAEVLSTAEFRKRASKFFIFARIDVDQQPQVFQAYNGEAMPTQLVLDKEGRELGRQVGYGNPEGFWAFLSPFMR